MNIHPLRLPSRQIQKLLAAALLAWSALAPAAQAMTPPPPNAHANAYGGDWTCNHGFVKRTDACVAVIAPANAYLNSSGTDWECSRGYRQIDARCAKTSVPANGYAVDSRFGPGWECERGYRQQDEACRPLVVPAHGHINYSGNDWRCVDEYRRSGDKCVAGQTQN
jgi:hypothetical protein